MPFDPDITVVIPLRDRTGVRLENCLRSLTWQELGTARLEVVVSDFGSSDEHLPEIRRLCEPEGVRCVRTDTVEIWNRARALNIGIQAARGSWVLCTDADMIFAPDFVRTLLDVHAAHPTGAMVHCHCHDLPEATRDRVVEKDDYPDLRNAACVRTTGGTGACQGASRQFFFHARGYDEKYRFWGAEDVDMTSRAQVHGLEVVWISERTSMLHQWHPTTKRERIWQYRWNKLRYLATRRQVVKNRRRWGNQS